MDQRSELTEVKAEREVMEREVHDQLLQLHSLQLQLYAKQGQAEDSDTIKDRLVGGTSQTSPNQATKGVEDCCLSSGKHINVIFYVMFC